MEHYLKYGTHLATTVVRNAQPGQAHGFAYLVDLDADHCRGVFTWDDQAIDWQGRGRQRGLRGVAFHGGRVLIAAHNRVLIFTPDFQLIGEVTGPLLANLHEIAVEGDLLYLTSTGFNSILVYDMAKRRFTEGYWLHYSMLGRRLRKMGLRPLPKLRVFDPEGAHPCPDGGHLHINMTYRDAGVTMVSGTHMGRLVGIRDGRLHSFGRIPYRTHNARRYRDGLICNDTSSHRIARFHGTLDVVEVFETPHFDVKSLHDHGLGNVIAVKVSHAAWWSGMTT